MVMRADDESDEGRRSDGTWRSLDTDRPSVVLLRETASTVAVVALLGLLLFAVSGVWPPMVAVESGSMEPEMHRGDLVVTAEEHRFSPAFGYADTGVVTHRIGARESYRTFHDYGDVVIYRPYGDPARTPIIHRARFWVNDSENWYAKANPKYLSGEDCDAVPNCPAPHAGFITKGDANDRYDQVMPLSGPVRPDWIRGTAEVRIPYLGYVRLVLA